MGVVSSFRVPTITRESPTNHLLKTAGEVYGVRFLGILAGETLVFDFFSRRGRLRTRTELAIYYLTF